MQPAEENRLQRVSRYAAEAALLLQLTALCVLGIVAMRVSPSRITGDVEKVIVGGPGASMAVSGNDLQCDRSEGDGVRIACNTTVDGHALAFTIGGVRPGHEPVCSARYDGSAVTCSLTLDYAGTRGSLFIVFITGTPAFGEEQVTRNRRRNPLLYWREIDSLALSLLAALGVSINTGVLVWQRIGASAWQRIISAAVSGAVVYVIVQYTLLVLLLAWGYVD